MLAKLAVRNVRRSVRDYAIYFVMLVFGVAVFYAFNSVHSQSILFDLEGAAQENTFDLTSQIMGMFSVVIACVLGLLVIYANRFLIKRRKQEFGIYLLLGMKPAQVSVVVLLETACVGAASLAVGLLAGVALSQGLSFFTAALFDIPMQQYRFVFSSSAFAQTLGCFALVFVVVGLFNMASIRRYKLIDLLSARERNERYRVRSPWVSLAGFVAAVAILAAAYVTLVRNGVMEFDEGFRFATALMIAGTLLFFWSIGGFVLALVERTRGVYFKRLAMFTMRQIASKVNTAFLSLSAVCVMLFFSLTVFSTGAGMVNVFSDSLEEGTQFDASLTASVFLATDAIDEEDMARMREEDPQMAEDYAREQEAYADEIKDKAGAWGWDVQAALRDGAPGWDDFVEGCAQIDLLQPAEGSDTYGDIMDRAGVSTGSQDQDEELRAQPVAVVAEGQFNELRALSGREPVDVGADGYAVDNAIDLTGDLARAMAEEGFAVEVAGHTLHATGQLVSQALVDQSFVSDALIVVVPDEVAAAVREAGETPYLTYLNLNYKVDRAQGDRMLYDALAQALPPGDDTEGVDVAFDGSPWPVSIVYTGAEVLYQALGVRMMVTYLALYIGFVLLITTAAMLAIQQLSETSDSLPRYRVLAELGCDRRMIMGSLRTQVLVYFLAPLGLAACHTACAGFVISSEMFSQVGVSIAGPVAMAVVLTAVVYGGYLLVTYFASRGIVKGYLGKKLLG